MKKLSLFLIVTALAGCVVLATLNAQDSEGVLSDVTPAGYEYAEPEECLGCHHQSTGWHGNYHLENAVGVENAIEGDFNTELEVTGVGWISSKHATSMDGASANRYCAWCHAPSLRKVTDDETKAKKVRNRKPGMSCIGCHTTHTIAQQFGTRYTNYLPGSDAEVSGNYIARHIENGKSANKQCLFCHGGYHGFAVSLHESMVKSGSLRCVDCHMAVYNQLNSGLEERYHNMKVFENGPDSCMGECHVHDFKKREMGAKIAKLMGGHTDRKNKLPTF